MPCKPSIRRFLVNSNAALQGGYPVLFWLEAMLLSMGPSEQIQACMLNSLIETAYDPHSVGGHLSAKVGSLHAVPFEGGRMTPDFAWPPEHWMWTPDFAWPPEHWLWPPQGQREGGEEGTGGEVRGNAGGSPSPAGAQHTQDLGGQVTEPQAPCGRVPDWRRRRAGGRWLH